MDMIEEKIPVHTQIVRRPRQTLMNRVEKEVNILLLYKVVVEFTEQNN